MDGIAQLVQQLSRIFAPVALVPYQLRNTPADRQRAGTGQYAIGARVATAVNVPVVITHDLARVPVMVQLLDNGTVAQTRLQITARSSTSVTVSPLDAALSASSLLFIN